MPETPLVHLDPNLGANKAIRINRREAVRLPQKSEEYSEMLGTILGDGYLGKKELTITGATHEKGHMEYVQKKIEELFGLKSRLFVSYTSQNTLVLDCYSRNLVDFLTSEGLVVGDKIRNGVAFPKWIFEKDEYIMGALRGLFDTDGGIYYKQKKYRRAIIEFQTASPNIRRDVILFLERLGFTPSKSMTVSAKNRRHNIRIQKQAEVHRFFRLVRSSNAKNIIRYLHFVEKGTIPLKKELNEEIINYTGEIPFRARP